jgi:NADH-quinone oxidoreductase subunit N
MNILDLQALLPLLVIGAASVIVMLQIAIGRSLRLSLALTLLGFVAALATLPLAAAVAPRQVTALLVIDNYSLFFLGLILAGGIVVAIMAYGYLAGYQGRRDEFYVLLLLASLGGAVLAASSHFATFFLGLETLSLALYGMIGYRRQDGRGIEAAVKYLILAGVTAAFLLFGMALVYFDLGSMAFEAIAGLASAGGSIPLELIVGFGLIIVGLGFKLALVPFQLWTPDVYQGAPAPVTAFIATVSKGAVFAVLLRYFSRLPVNEPGALFWAFAAISIASMLFGNLLALLQSNVKRILAYSSIAHLGYLLIPFLAAGSFGPSAVGFYLIAYFATTLTAFGVVTVLSTPGHEAEELEDYRGLFYRRPWLALAFTVSLLSLAGIPPTIGLIGKIYLASAGVQSQLWVLLILLALASVIGVFYYMRVAVTLFRRQEEELPASMRLPSASWLGSFAMAALTLLIVSMGVFPAPLLNLVQSLVVP